jgi:hypothetical protein
MSRPAASRRTVRAPARPGLRGAPRRLLAAVAGPGDDGNAVVEFIGLSVVLIIPVAYLALTLGRVQGAVFATEAAARESARVYVSSTDRDQAVVRAQIVAGLALRDQGFEDDPSTALALACSSQPCLEPGSQVTARVEVQVPLPFVPGFVRDLVPLQVPVAAERTAPVDEFRTAP